MRAMPYEAGLSVDIISHTATHRIQIMVLIGAELPEIELLLESLATSDPAGRSDEEGCMLDMSRLCQ